MNRADEIYDMAHAAASQITNLHFHPDPCMRYQAVLGVVHTALRLIVMEEREKLRQPSQN